MAETRWRSEIQLIAPPSDRDVAAEELGAAMHQLLEALVAGGRMDRARPPRSGPRRSCRLIPIEAEGGVQHAHREVELVFGDQRADFDLAGGDCEQVDPALGQHREHCRGELRIGPDADADDADLGHRIVVDQARIADVALALLDDRQRLRQARARDGEGQVRRPGVGGCRVDDHVDLDPRLGDRADDGGHGAGLVGDAGQRDPRLVAVGGDAGDQVAFHLRLLKARRRCPFPACPRTPTAPAAANSRASQARPSGPEAPWRRPRRARASPRT